MNTDATNRRLKTKELAAHIGVTPRTIQNYRDQGKIPFVRINARTFRYNLADVEKALSASKQ